jgi:hypothetical protein
VRSGRWCCRHAHRAVRVAHGLAAPEQVPARGRMRSAMSDRYPLNDTSVLDKKDTSKRDMMRFPTTRQSDWRYRGESTRPVLFGEWARRPCGLGRRRRCRIFSSRMRRVIAASTSADRASATSITTFSVWAHYPRRGARTVLLDDTRVLAQSNTFSPILPVCSPQTHMSRLSQIEEACQGVSNRCPIRRPLAHREERFEPSRSIQPLSGP